MDALILILAILPVIVLLFYIYKKDKYEKEPLRMLILAFVLGLISVPLVLLLDSGIMRVWYSDGLVYNAFILAGVPEELCKWALFMAVIWWNKNFNESFDGIVYAVFISLGFACVENIMYVFSSDTVGEAVHTGVLRAILSVPGHFLFAVIMGYFLGMAKFDKQKRAKYLIFSYIFPMLAHGIFDYLLMLAYVASYDNMSYLAGILYAAFIVFDVRMWKIGVRNIYQMQEMSRIENNNKVLKDIFKS